MIFQTKCMKKFFYFLLGNNHWVKKHTRVCSKTQFVFAILTSHTKEIVLGVSCFSGRVFKIHPKPASSFRQPMNVVESEPKFAIQISEASFVVIPTAVEINRAIQSLLEHCPPTTGCCLVTEHHDQGRLDKHRLFVYRPCRFQRSSCKLKIAEGNISCVFTGTEIEAAQEETKIIVLFLSNVFSPKNSVMQISINDPYL